MSSSTSNPTPTPRLSLSAAASSPSTNMAATTSSSSSSSQAVLLKQFKELTINPVSGFTIALQEENVYKWTVGVMGPPDTIYQGGYFLATLAFPTDYPFSPPTFTFNKPFFHPNVYDKTGGVCISILHPPGEDSMSGERPEERWTPIQSVSSILLSIISLLNDPNISSPANVDAGVLFRNDREAYNAVVRNEVEDSKKDIPEGMEMPTTASDYQYGIGMGPKQERTPDEDSSFWNEDDAGSAAFAFSGSEEEEEEEEELNL